MPKKRSHLFDHFKSNTKTSLYKMQIILQFDFIIQSQWALSSTDAPCFSVLPFCIDKQTNPKTRKTAVQKKNLKQGVVLLVLW